MPEPHRGMENGDGIVFIDTSLDGRYTVRARRNKSSADNSAGILEILNNLSNRPEQGLEIFFERVADGVPMPTEAEMANWRKWAAGYLDI